MTFWLPPRAFHMVPVPPSSGNSSARVAALVTRIVMRRQVLLLARVCRYPLMRRAVPLDLTERRPMEAALSRNIQAALSEDASSCCF